MVVLSSFQSVFNSKILQVLNYTNIRMVEGMKSISEQNAEATKRMKELAELNHRITEQSAEATRRLTELAEVNRQQVAQGARQAQSMAILAYDTKRDSEVMKAITVVTLVFLPATFLSVRPILRLEFHCLPSFSLPDSL